jgi:hypothetical protein
MIVSGRKLAEQGIRPSDEVLRRKRIKGANQRVYVNALRFFKNDIVDLLLYNERVGNDELVRTITFGWDN